MTESLRDRARRAGVLTSYADWAGRQVTVPDDAVAAVLAAAGELADGAIGARPVQDAVPPAMPDAVPTAMPGAGPGAVPDLLGRRAWGWQVQLYQLRSARSWGIGDYADLARLARATAAQGSDLLLVNPLHAVTPVAPVHPSPYFASSRRFAWQLGVAIDALPEYVEADPGVRASVDALRPANQDLIDRDAVWRAKHAAFALLLPDEVPDDDPTLAGFAAFCALAEVHGPDWRRWPEPLRRSGPSALAAADPDRARLHRWVQLRAAEQLDAAQQAARDAGMAVGIVHDLAVGVDPGGADAWLLQDDVASGASVGAPPDPFNQLGQDWTVPPFRPARLAATGYAAFRQVLRAALAHGGGLRIDHVMGLFRLWWVPAGKPPTLGAYVRYDSDATLAALVAEARAAGALVIGEDLGTVDPPVREALDRAGILGSAVLWFEREDDEITPLPPVRWRERAAASVSTHDLPTAYGFLAGEPLRVRAELGLLTLTREEEARRLAGERARLLGLLRDQGLLADQATDEETVQAMYRLLLRSPSQIVLAAPADAVGDLRQPNLPGTSNEYPNWRLPLADRAGRPVSLEEFLAAPGTARLAEMLRSALSPSAPGSG